MTLSATVAVISKLLLYYLSIYRKFESVFSDFGLLKKALGAVEELDATAMRKPKSFSACSITTALAVVMATPLSVVLRSSLSSTVAACIGDTETQSKVI